MDEQSIMSHEKRLPRASVASNSNEDVDCFLPASTAVLKPAPALAAKKKSARQKRLCGVVDENDPDLMLACALSASLNGDSSEHYVGQKTTKHRKQNSSLLPVECAKAVARERAVLLLWPDCSSDKNKNMDNTSKPYRFPASTLDSRLECSQLSANSTSMETPSPLSLWKAAASPDPFTSPCATSTPAPVQKTITPSSCCSSSSKSSIEISSIVQDNPMFSLFDPVIASTPEQWTTEAEKNDKLQLALNDVKRNVYLKKRHVEAQLLCIWQETTQWVQATIQNRDRTIEQILHLQDNEGDQNTSEAGDIKHAGILSDSDIDVENSIISSPGERKSGQTVQSTNLEPSPFVALLFHSPKLMGRSFSPSRQYEVIDLLSSSPCSPINKNTREPTPLCHDITENDEITDYQLPLPTSSLSTLNNRQQIDELHSSNACYMSYDDFNDEENQLDLHVLLEHSDIRLNAVTTAPNFDSTLPLLNDDKVTIISDRLSDSEKPTENLDTSSAPVSLPPTKLENLTVMQLRELARLHTINLSSNRKKADIIATITIHQPSMDILLEESNSSNLDKVNLLKRRHAQSSTTGENNNGADIENDQTSGAIEKQLLTYLSNHSTFYPMILRYEPISFVDLQTELKNSGIQCAKKQLIEIMDLQGINFIPPTIPSDNNRYRKKKKVVAKKVTSTIQPVVNIMVDSEIVM